jgi:methylated-DNA-protein-cysteine methyltransferase-like protein
VYRRRKTPYHVGSMQNSAAAYARILRAVASIPRGRVASYGQVAALAGLPGRARQVGYALRMAGDGEVPWHRVVNARGVPSLVGDARELQCRRLRKEGVVFDANGRIDLARFGIGARVKAGARRARP